MFGMSKSKGLTFYKSVPMLHPVLLLLLRVMRMNQVKVGHQRSHTGIPWDGGVDNRDQGISPDPRVNFSFLLLQNSDLDTNVNIIQHSRGENKKM